MALIETLQERLERSNKLPKAKKEAAGTQAGSKASEKDLKDKSRRGPLFGGAGKSSQNNIPLDVRRGRLLNCSSSTFSANTITAPLLSALAIYWAPATHA